MSDVLIRDVPDHVLRAVDARASALGMSRSAYLRRKLEQEVAGASASVTVEDLAVFGETFADLGDADVMRSAWS